MVGLVIAPTAAGVRREVSVSLLHRIKKMKTEGKKNHDSCIAPAARHLSLGTRSPRSVHNGDTCSRLHVFANPLASFRGCCHGYLMLLSQAGHLPGPGYFTGHFSDLQRAVIIVVT